jgi:hypothetical protein
MTKLGWMWGSLRAQSKTAVVHRRTTEAEAAENQEALYIATIHELNDLAYPVIPPRRPQEKS